MAECLREAALCCQASGVDSLTKTTWLLTMWFRQQLSCSCEMIADELRIRDSPRIDAAGLQIHEYRLRLGAVSQVAKQVTSR